MRSSLSFTRSRASILSGKTSYHQISWSLEAARLDAIMIVSLWNLTRHLESVAAEMPVKFQSDWKSIIPNLAASRLHEILRLVNKGPGKYTLVKFAFWNSFHSWKCISKCLQNCGHFIQVCVFKHYGIENILFIYENPTITAITRQVRVRVLSDHAVTGHNWANIRPMPVGTLCL